MTPHIAIQREDFDPGREIAALENFAAGAIACFCGNVRGERGLVALELEHYPTMTRTALVEIVEEAVARWSLVAVRVIHRHGRLDVGAHIVFIGMAASHRESAIAAMHFVIDRLKTDAPFWKCEHFADGRRAWVAAQCRDAVARRSWEA